MKYRDVELFIFQNGMIISGKFDVVNSTYVLYKLSLIVTKQPYGSEYFIMLSLNRINPMRAKNIIYAIIIIII